MENQVYTDEINLFDYLKIIYKWKLLIIVLCIISVVATYIITSRPMPATYRVTALLSPGALSYTPDGKEIPIDSAANFQSLIQNGTLNPKIIEKLKLDPAQYSGMQFTTQMPKDSDVIRIFYDTPDPEKGKVIVNELMNQLSDSYKNRLVLNREAVSKQIDKIKNTQKLLQNKKERKNNEKKRLLSDSELMRNKLVLLIDSENNLQGRLKKAEENMDSLTIAKDELLKKGDKTDTASVIFYSGSIQQAIIHIETIHSRIENKRMTEAEIKNTLIHNETIVKDLDTEANEIDAQIKDIEISINDIKTQTASPESIKILQEPTAGINTIEKRTGKKVAAAGITALFIGIMLAFFIEYIKKMQRAAG